MKLKPLTLLFLAMLSTSSIGAIIQSKGVDQNVDYKSLERLGPWDDRNYQLTKTDLDILPENDHYLSNVPLFYKVKARKSNPRLGKYYNRELYQSFLIEHGGLIVDGVWYKEGIGKYYHPLTLDGKPDPEFKGGIVDLDGENVLDSGAESTIEFNPDNNMQAVAGVNANGGQSMYYSSDGGETWALSQVNPNSCCDPTIDWSTKALPTQRVYQADLASCISAGCNIRAAYSDDAGKTWSTMIMIDDDQRNDKEFIHVDRSPSSPYVDNVYITYHKSNVMHFAKSEDNGVTWTTPVALNTSDRGIGSDITTDSAGNIYYIYPSTSGAGLISMKSTNGGDSFNAPVQITTLRGEFDFPIPAMETRKVFIYAAADVDSNDNIFVAITDETADSDGGSQNVVSTNRGEIRVFKSTDGGTSYSELAKPHPDNGQLSGGSNNAIDRFHPWMMVGENDAIHIAFYDTRHSNNRTGVDFYYNVSTDGGTSWLPQGAQRITETTSPNINDGFEWGDYNGLSVVQDKLGMIWTDNRTNSTNAMFGYAENQFNSATFGLSASPTSFEVCSNDTGLTSELNISDIQSYPGTITLSIDSQPGYVVNSAFSANNQGSPFTSNFSFDVNGSGVTGSETLVILASGDDMGNVTEKVVNLTINYASAAPSVANLTVPADNATNISGGAVTYNWDAIAGVSTYLIEISDDVGFNNIIDSATVNTNSFAGTVGLAPNTEYYWRVTASNACGTGSTSAEFSFITSNEICISPNIAIPDGDANGVDVQLNVGLSGTINSLLAQVDSNHSYPGDLIFRLTNGNTNTSVVLMDRPGYPATTWGCSQEGVEAEFDDNGTQAVETSCAGSSPGIGGSLTPEQALSNFAGEEVNGTWTLNAIDTLGLFTGSINKFCIIPDVTPVVPACDPPSPVGDPDVIFRNGFQCVQQP